MTTDDDMDMLRNYPRYYMEALGRSVEFEMHSIAYHCGAHERPRGYTYVVEAAGLIKIGRAAFDAAERVKRLAAMVPVPVKLVGLCHDAGMERLVHDQLWEERAHGEWFRTAARPLPLVPRGQSYDNSTFTCMGCVRARSRASACSKCGGAEDVVGVAVCSVCATWVGLCKPCGTAPIEGRSAREAELQAIVNTWHAHREACGWPAAP